MYRIAFATPNYDVWDIRRGSGSYYTLCKELADRGHHVQSIGPVKYNLPLLTRLQKKVSKFQGKRFRSWQDVFAARAIGESVSKSLLAHQPYDFLLTNDYSVAAYADGRVPIVLYTDSVFPSNYRENAHPWLSNLPWFNVASCQHVTRRALQRSRLCCFPTAWARKELGKYATFDADKVKVIPFGSNMATPSAHIALNRALTRLEEKATVQLLFVGRDWELKGGQIVLQVAQQLNDVGIKTIMHIVGSTPPDRDVPDYVKLYGLLNKDIEYEKEQLIRLFCESDIFILPTRAEGFGIVFAEAASFGLPSLAFDTTGVSTAVKHGQSGILIPLDSPNPADEFVKKIVAWRDNPNEYQAYVAGARSYYENTVNWKAAVDQLLIEIGSIL